MTLETKTNSNVKQAVPFFRVSNLESREFRSRGIQASTPFVGNGMWVTSLSDPDGYRIEFESYTDVPEETEFSETV